MNARTTTQSVFLALALFAGACRPPLPDVDADGVTRIDFWNGFSGPDGKAMERIVRDFNRANPRIRVRMQIVPWATYYDKVTLGLASRDAPDLFVMHAARVPEYAAHGALAPMDDLMARSGLGPRDFAPLAWPAGQWKGRRYALPLDCHPLGMYYNRTLFAQAGIPRPPRTRAEFLDAARRLTRDTNGDGRPDQWGFALTDLHFMGATLFAQYGGGLLTPDHARSALDTPASLAALRDLESLVERERIAPRTTGDDSWTAFRQGKVAMVFQGIWMIDSLDQTKGLDYAAAPVPTLGPRRRVWAGAHCLAIPAYLSPARQRAAWEFVRYLSDHSLEWAKGGQIPVRPFILDSPEFRALRVQREFAKQLPYVELEPASPAVNQVGTFADIAVQSVVQGLETPERALKVAAARVERVLERQ